MLGLIKKLFGAKDTAPTPPPVEAPYKIDISSVNPMSPVAIPVEITAETVVITSEAVAPTLVSDTIVTEPVQPAASKPAVKRGSAKAPKPKATPKSAAKASKPKPKSAA